MNLRPRTLLLAAILSFSILTASAWTTQPAPRREVRAVWLTTIGGLDWPHSYAHTAAGIARQQQELCAHLDRLRALGINTVLLQTRIRGTVIYPSAYEPWDGCLSGRPGMSPGYDALAFAVEECHKRGMAIQAWVVAFPLTSLTVTRQLGAQSIIRRHPALCMRTGDHWMMNPGIPATADYLAGLCREIVERYDVDGIHLDYIRYPEKEVPFDDRRTFRRYGHGESLSEWRRANVTRCVKQIYDAVKAVKPWVMVSCSPVGKHDDLPRYSSYGWNARTTVSQDVQRWMSEGIMDEIFPMMYFRGNHFYPFALDWTENASGRIVVPGLGAYFLAPDQKDWPLETVTRELSFLRIIGAGGAAFFRSRFLEDNVKGLGDFLSGGFYSAPTLLPAMTWADSIAPAAPAGLRASASHYAMHISWLPPHDPTPGDSLRYNVYVSDSFPVVPSRARLMASYLRSPACDIDIAAPSARRSYYAVTAIDRFGNESAPAAVNHPSPLAIVPAGLPEVRDGVLRTDTIDAGVLILRDAVGDEVMTVRNNGKVDVSALPAGVYKLYGQGRRGSAHLTGRFLIPLP